MPGLELKVLAEYVRLLSEDSRNWIFIAIDLRLDFLVTAVVAVSIVGLICWITGYSGCGRRGSAIS
jgi:hypothetical protein